MVKSISEGQDSQKEQKEQKEGRQSRRRQQTRQALLEAGRRLFALKGVSETPINEITEAADLGFGTFYLYFQSKEELYEEIMRAGIAEVQQKVLEAILSANNTEAQIRAGVLEFLRYAYLHRDFVQLLDRSLRTGVQLQSIMEVTNTIGSRLMALVQPTADALQIELLGRMLTGVLRQASSWWVSHTEPSPEEMTETVMQVMNKGFFSSPT